MTSGRVGRWAKEPGTGAYCNVVNLGSGYRGN